jgi:hypothetical protein
MAITASEFKSFAITQHKGFRLSFENGWGVSIQFGPGNYCDPQGGRNGYRGFDAPQKANVWRANSAEVAVFRPDGEFLSQITSGDDVVGYVSSNTAAILLATVSVFSDETEEQAREAVRAVLGE